ncbi:hypothetical protein LCGC14_0507440 [marine sediment metagenome]|uniref:Glycosyl transferase family 1 domain-containing protein n=1 Tax=marine sediment metagenome TaxID=412755 RepID=A0A0F9UNW2_9ZZZZ
MTLTCLWHSAPCYYPTGYGVQTRGFAHRIAVSEHDIAVVMTTINLGIEWEGILHLPGGKEPFSIEGVLEWTRRLKADIVFTLFDVWPLPENMGELINRMGAKWAPIAPIDHDPIPQDVLKRLIHADYPIAMSRFAEREMKRVGLEPIYIPHGVETNVFKPVQPDKSMFAAEDMFMVGIVATNLEPMDRKGWKPALDAFGKFYQKHPNSRLYAHCEPSRADSGYDLAAIASEYGFKVYTPDMWQLVGNGIPSTRMAQIYSTFDVLLMLTRGEGFGVPLIEAQACGTPVIVTDFTACSDLVGAGWKIPITGKRWTPMSSWWAEPDVDAAVEALEEAYDLWEKGELEKKFKIKARAFAKAYDFDVVYQMYMAPFLERVDGEIKAEKSDERSGQAPSEHSGQRGVGDSGQGDKPKKKRKRRR